jgi:NADH-quinone oxidoreductase subunit B
MLMDAILKIHAKIMDEPLGPKRAAALAESGHRTELVPSSIKFAKKK